jgi:hypothetical protein
MLATPPTLEKISAKNARTIGANFAADHLGDQIGVGMPWRVVSSLRSAWATPLVLTAPGHGIVGIVGLLIIDEELGHITAWTTVEELNANANQLLEERKDDLDAAFKRAVAQPAA